MEEPGQLLSCPEKPPDLCRIWGKVLIFLAPLALLWWRLIDHLHVEWNLNPQYGYGWAVPFLCAYLLWQRIRSDRAFSNPQPSTLTPQLPPTIPLPAFLIPALAFLYLPIRLIEEANPEWRLVSWSLALVVIGLTLVLLPLLLQLLPFRRHSKTQLNTRPSFPSGTSNFGLRTSNFGLRTSDLLFPLLYFLVAVPWPTFIEAPLIRGLTAANAAVTVEVVDLLGVPAIQQGNLIRVATGVVGIDEACSGIRSFQATLMISFFLGELYRFSIRRRVYLCLAGFGLSFLFNVGRTSLLTWVASEKGTASIANWHDPAGAIILVACFISLWLLALRFAKPGNSENQESPPSAPQLSTLNPQPSTTTHVSLGLALFTWFIASELGVYTWYRTIESRLPAPAPWGIVLPVNNSSLKKTTLPDVTREMLKCDEYQSASWTEPGALRWQAIFLYWKPGAVAGYLSKVHNPQTCLPSTGHQLVSFSPPQLYPVPGLELPFSHYIFTRAGQTKHVFYCMWDDRRKADPYLQQGQGIWSNRLKAVWQGRGNSGQRILELVLWGIEDSAEAQAAFLHQLQSLIKVEQ